MLTYEYKDSFRCYWTVKIEKTEDFKLEFGEKHYYWRYSIMYSEWGFAKEKTEQTIIYSGTVLGQYESTPSLEDVLIDWQARFVGVCIGMNKWATLTEVKD